jgi:aryl-alcohol dehydrogenase-like predicted oxidoreductase
MDYTTLGRTGLRVSVMGMGGGGPSRLGQRENKPAAESVAILQAALDAGVNFIDTAEAYDTEDIVGQAIAGRDRDALVISTKKSTWQGISPDDVRASLDNSLKRLGTDYVDVYHLHGVAPKDYHRLRDEIVPVLEDLRSAGKIRFIGITEAFNSDKQHETLRFALQDDCWEVMMIGFNILNQTAREMILQPAMQQNIGTLIMFAVRLALSKPERLRETVAELIERGELDANEIDVANPLGFVLGDGGAVSVPDAAYRFCRYEPGAHVILSGTGSLDHLRENIASLQRPPLPETTVERLRRLFARVESTTGQ